MAVQINRERRAQRGQFMDFRVGNNKSTNSKVRPGHSVPDIRLPQNEPETIAVHVQARDDKMEATRQDHVPPTKKNSVQAKNEAEKNQPNPLHQEKKQAWDYQLKKERMHHDDSMQPDFRQHLLRSQRRAQIPSKPTLWQKNEADFDSVENSTQIDLDMERAIQPRRIEPMRRIPARQVFNVSHNETEPTINQPEMSVRPKHLAERPEAYDELERIIERSEAGVKDDIEDIEFGLIEDLDMHARHPQPKSDERRIEGSKLTDGGILEVGAKEKDEAEKSSKRLKNVRKAAKHRMKSPFLKSVTVEKRPLSDTASAAAMVAAGGLGGVGSAGNVIAKTGVSGAGVLGASGATGAMARGVAVHGLTQGVAGGTVGTVGGMAYGTAGKMAGSVANGVADGARAGIKTGMEVGSKDGVGSRTTTGMKTAEIVGDEDLKVSLRDKPEEDSKKSKKNKKDKSQKVGPTVIVSQKHKLRSNIGLGIAVTLTVIVGGVVGAFIYLAFFQQ